MIGMGDHPRVCGEHCGEHSASFGVLGSSPRMRGTLRRAFRKFRRLGIIPAYAGNTQPVSPCRQCNRDHPRVCGEHNDDTTPDYGDVGSSPRMRGTPFVVIAVTVWRGIIPAYAGNTLPVLPNPFSPRDHPRVCGEHGEIDVCMAGNMGSSPRMRGTPHDVDHGAPELGIIPAYAGNTITLSAMHEAYWDHPRVCGEHATGASTQVNCTGSSPRMRGTPAVTEATNNTARIIPAYAGNTPAACWKSWQAWDHPRVCGEHQSCLQRIRLSRGSSPRMRGTLRGLTLGLDSPGIIPAYAGNTDH